MREQESLEPHNLFAKLGDSSCESIIFRAKDFYLLLEIGQPLLLPLSTFEGGDTVTMLAHMSQW